MLLYYVGHEVVALKKFKKCSKKYLKSVPKTLKINKYLTN